MTDLDLAVHDLAARQHGVFSRQQALEAGASPDQVKWRLKTGRWQVHRPGVLAVTGSIPTWEQRQMACCLAIDADATHRAGAALWNLPGMFRPRPELTVEHGRRVVVRGALVHQSKDLHLYEPTLRDGIPTTPLARTVLDVGAVMDEESYGAFVRAVIREGRLSWDDLYETVVRHGRRGRDGVGRLRSIVEAEHGLVSTDSEFERLVERILVDAGLPEPERQHQVLGSDGRPLARVDLAYPNEQVAIELDGERFHREGPAFDRDRWRQNELVLLGWTVLRFTWEHLVRSPWTIVRQVKAARSRDVEPSGG